MSGSERPGVPPGDPAVLRAAAGRLQGAAGALQAAAASVRRDVAQVGPGTWTGAGAQGFAGAAGRYAAHLDRARGALDEIGGGLSAYAVALAAAQAQARAAAAAAAAARAEAAGERASVLAAPLPSGPGAAAAREQALAAIAEALVRAETRAAAEQAQARADATAAAGRAAGQVEAATATLRSLVAAPPGMLHALATANDRAGWVLDSWGLYSAGLITGKAGMFGAAAWQLAIDEAAVDGAVTRWLGGDATFADVTAAAERALGSTEELGSAFQDLRGAIAPLHGEAGFVNGLSRGLVGLGMVADAATLVDPGRSSGPDGLLGGTTARVAAGANLAASGLALGDSLGYGLAASALAIPGVDVVVGVALAGTAVYFAGELVYQHWHDIAHAAEAVGHAVDAAGRAVGHAADGAAAAVGHAVDGAAAAVGHAADGAAAAVGHEVDGVGHALGGAAHEVLGWL